MAYTDIEMKDATQIAYMQCFSEAEKKLIEKGKQKPFTVRELIEASVDMKDIKLRALELNEVPDVMSFQELMKFSNLSKEDIERISLLQPEALDWKVIDIHDRNNVNGFYACTLETSDKAAIIAFRGSDDQGNSLVNDWILADFGLLRSTKTNQQAETERYADELLQRGIIDNYEFLAATGHSLGGNLASHLNVISSEEGRETLCKKLQQVVNMDGPGMSHDYIERHSGQIDRTSSKLTHYKWSTVGNLLYDIPGEKTEFLYSDESVYAHKNELMRSFFRHDTKTICFDENGNAKRGKQDELSKLLGPVSRVIDSKAWKILRRAITGIATISDFRSIIANIGNELVNGKKSGVLDILGATFKDPKINREAINSVTTFFNDMINGKLNNLENSNRTGEMVKA